MQRTGPLTRLNASLSAVIGWSMSIEFPHGFEANRRWLRIAVQAALGFTLIGSVSIDHALADYGEKELLLAADRALAEQHQKLVDWSERIDQQARVCQSKPTELQASIQLSKLNDLFRGFVANRRFRMPSPGRACAQRAYLINKYLADLGFKSEVVVLRAPAIVGLMFKEQGQVSSVHEYEFHVFATIQVMPKAGRVERYALDPQFFDRPMAFDRYVELLTGSRQCKNVGLVFARDDRAYGDSHCRYVVNQPAPNPKLIQASDPRTQNVARTCAWVLMEQNEAFIDSGGERESSTEPSVLAYLRGTKDPRAAAIRMSLRRAHQELKGDVQAWTLQLDPGDAFHRALNDQHKAKQKQALEIFEKTYGPLLSGAK